ncbi:inositol monophosphatase family protein [Pararhizobium sp. IMCC21322]|uniref:inositol monophosphatase family protein n=1 Tax=Pararhizobium sp. IMCC21322 TaxID=3067903 RepID=UPI00274289DC|nr:inositol monophosphatase family protein [Pararhizobium sp. IMCC21322]
MTSELDTRLDSAKTIAKGAGDMALDFFQDIGKLIIESKGVQDMVSNADRDVETFVREELAKHFPDDGIVGEEHANVEGTSGYTWVIDPIDGTANFVNNIPAWCVILACVHDDETKIGVIYAPWNDELFWGGQRQGRFCQ